MYDPIGEDLSNNIYVLHITTKWACKGNAGAADCTGYVSLEIKALSFLYFPSRFGPSPVLAFSSLICVTASFTFNGAFVFFFFFVLGKRCQAWRLLLSFTSFLLLKLVCVSSSAYVASADGAAVLAQVWSSEATKIGKERRCCLGHLSRSVTTPYLRPAQRFCQCYQNVVEDPRWCASSEFTGAPTETQQSVCSKTALATFTLTFACFVLLMTRHRFQLSPRFTS